MQHAEIINHPNMYVEESRRVYQKIASGNIKQEPLAHTSIAQIAGTSGVKTERVMESSPQTSSSATKKDEIMEYDITMDDDMDAGIFQSVEAMGY